MRGLMVLLSARRVTALPILEVRWLYAPCHWGESEDKLIFIFTQDNFSHRIKIGIYKFIDNW